MDQPKSETVFNNITEEFTKPMSGSKFIKNCINNDIVVSIFICKITDLALIVAWILFFVGFRETAQDRLISSTDSYEIFDYPLFWNRNFGHKYTIVTAMQQRVKL